jgi:hypothetical protein
VSVVDIEVVKRLNTSDVPSAVMIPFEGKSEEMVPPAQPAQGTKLTESDEVLTEKHCDAVIPASGNPTAMEAESSAPV